MDINVKVTTILQPVGYTKKDGTMGARYSFIGTTTTGRYDKTIKFDVNTQERWNDFHIMVGATYNVSFDIESREWNGKWYTSCDVWKVVGLDTAGNNGNQVF